MEEFFHCSLLKATRIPHLQSSCRCDEENTPVWKNYSDFTIWTHRLWFTFD